jgi:hypothetical protein
MLRFATRLLVIGWAILIALSARGWAQTQNVGQNMACLLYLDGKNLIEDAHYPLENDQLISLETYDLLPYSPVELTALQKGVPIFKKSYPTNEKGAMKDILFFPKARSAIRCTLHFTTKNGESKKLIFHLNPA